MDSDRSAATPQRQSRPLIGAYVTSTTPRTSLSGASAATARAESQPPTSSLGAAFAASNASAGASGTETRGRGGGSAIGARPGSRVDSPGRRARTKRGSPTVASPSPRGGRAKPFLRKNTGLGGGRATGGANDSASEGPSSPGPSIEIPQSPRSPKATSPLSPKGASRAQQRWSFAAAAIVSLNRSSRKRRTKRGGTTTPRSTASPTAGRTPRATRASEPRAVAPEVTQAMLREIQTSRGKAREQPDSGSIAKPAAASSSAGSSLTHTVYDTGHNRAGGATAAAAGSGSESSSSSVSSGSSSDSGASGAGPGAGGGAPDEDDSTVNAVTGAVTSKSMQGVLAALHRNVSDAVGQLGLAPGAVLRMRQLVRTRVWTAAEETKEVDRLWEAERAAHAAALRSQREEYEAKVELVQQQLRFVTAELAQVSAKHVGYRNQVSSNSMKLHEAVQQMSSELDAKSKLLEQARVELSLSSHAREAIRAERSTNDELRKQVKDTTEQLTNLAQVAAQLQRNLTDAYGQLDALRTSKAGAEQALVHLKTEHDELRARFEAKIGQLMLANQMVDTLQAQVDATGGQERDVEEETRTLRELLMDSRNALVDALAERDAANTEVARLQRELADAQGGVAGSGRGIAGSPSDFGRSSAGTPPPSRATATSAYLEHMLAGSAAAIAAATRASLPVAQVRPSAVARPPPPPPAHLRPPP